ncbi:ras-like protein rasG isoform X1 [Patiria miniata]|uniref:small monomeric GTPase n=2 Tax=Patiria miniata TaxID=46514 RepID=A0A914BS41_PATMI|nr:ras-like protein rasG isoform X1 [Patiria miniata]XP_038078327.1 ras-like protein rasG isoform X1 [Patiria miniata]
MAPSVNSNVPEHLYDGPPSPVEKLKTLARQFSRFYTDEMKTDKGSHGFRLVLLGNDGVGKSAIAVRFLCGRYLHEYDPTLESRYEKMETVDGKTTRIEVFDTAGQTHLEDYLQAADAVLFVYSITDRVSFDAAKIFRERLQSSLKSHLPILLVGNKRELEQGRRVSTKEGFSLAREAGWRFHEVSAATDSVGLKATILDFVREAQGELRRLKVKKGWNIRRAVSVLYGHSKTSIKEETVIDEEPVFTTQHSTKVFQRRQTCPSL